MSFPSRLEAVMTNSTQQQTVSLGCGTLILIGLIVLFFSRPATKDLEREIQTLRGEIGQLRESIDALRQAVQPPRPGPQELQRPVDEAATP
jgi:hypothetical protein